MVTTWTLEIGGDLFLAVLVVAVAGLVERWWYYRSLAGRGR